MGGKTSEKMRENRKDPVEGIENEVTKQLAERAPRSAGHILDTKGHAHMRDSAPAGAAPDKRLTANRNFSCEGAAKNTNSCHAKAILGMV